MILFHEMTWREQVIYILGEFANLPWWGWTGIVGLSLSAIVVIFAVNGLIDDYISNGRCNCRCMKERER